MSFLRCLGRIVLDQLQLGFGCEWLFRFSFWRTTNFNHSCFLLRLRIWTNGYAWSGSEPVTKIYTAKELRVTWTPAYVQQRRLLFPHLSFSRQSSITPCLNFLFSLSLSPIAVAEPRFRFQERSLPSSRRPPSASIFIARVGASFSPWFFYYFYSALKNSF